MADALYNPFKESLLSQNPSVDLDTDTIRAIFVTSGYSFSASHQYFSDLGANTIGDGGTTRSDGVALSSKSVTSGTFDAATISWTLSSFRPPENGVDVTKEVVPRN